MTYAKEIKGTWYGVEIPAWLRVFDCRQSDEDMSESRAPWTVTTSTGEHRPLLWSGERAEVDCGLRTKDDRHATTPHSCQAYTDFRKANDATCAKYVREMIVEAERERAVYEKAKANPKADKGHGGSCYYMPVFAYLANYGWGVTADQRTMVVEPFQ
jgi:hypothetical protein